MDLPQLVCTSLEKKKATIKERENKMMFRLTITQLKTAASCLKWVHGLDCTSRV